MENFQNKVAVITGAGSGIGRELALQLAARGAKVAINDYNANTLAETGRAIDKNGGTAVCYPFDVSDRDLLYQFADDVLKQFGQVDLVINNAGVSLGGYDTLQISDEDFEWLININMWGVIHGSRAFLPHLLKRPEASLVNISSVFGLFGVPQQSPYCTAKYAVKGFTESIRRELLESNVTVSVVHPGGIKTNIVRNGRHASTADLEQLAQEFDEQLARTTAADAAATIIKGIQKKRSIILIGNDARLINLATRILPQKWFDRLVLRQV